MKTVLIDTNFLVECARNKIDIQTELRRILDTSFDTAILDRTMDELETIVARGGKEGSWAKLAKTILLTKKVTIIATSGGHTDNLLLDRANADTIIATMDKELKRKLKKKLQDVVIIRAAKKLAVVNA